MERFARFVVQYPKSVLAAVFIITAALAPGLLNTDMRPVLEGDLPRSDSRVMEDETLKEVFPDRNFYVFSLECPEGVFTESCIAWVKQFVDEAEDVDGLSSHVQSIITYNYIRADEDTISVSDLVGDDVPATSVALSQLRMLVRSDPLLYPRLVSADETATLVWFALANELSQHEAYEIVRNLKRAFDDGAQHRVHIFGKHFINEEIDRGVARDIAVLLPFSLLFIGVVISVSLLWQAMFVVAAVLVLSIAWSFGLMGLFGIPKSVLTSTIPVVLVAIVSSHCFHIIHRIRREYWELAIGRGDAVPVSHQLVRRAVVAAISRVGMPVLMTGITSSLGMATLVVFRILSVREFGLFASIGIASGMVLSLTVIPASVVSFFPGIAAKPIGRIALLFESWNHTLVLKWFNAAAYHPAFVTVCSMALCAGMLIGVSKLHIGSQGPHYFPKGMYVRDGFDALMRQFGGDGFVSVLIDSGKANGVYDPSFLRRMEQFQRMVEQEDEVAFATSVVEVVKRMNRMFHGGNPVREVVPNNKALIAQLMFLYENDARETLEQMVDFDKRYAVMDLLIDANDSAVVDALYRTVQRRASLWENATVYCGSDLFLWSAQNHYIVRGKLINIAVCFVVISLFCAVALRSFVGGLIAVVPVGLAVLLVFGLMGYVGIHLDLANCVITSIVVGVGVDFAIHLLFAMKHEARSAQRVTHRISLTARAVEAAGIPIQYDCLSNLAFLIFLFSAFVPLRNFGWLISFSMVAATVSTLVLIPALVLAVQPRFLKPRRDEQLATVVYLKRNVH